jgi:hypothetical protein
MRKGLLAALTVLLASHAALPATPVNPVSQPPTPPAAATGDELLPPGGLPEEAPALGDVDAQARPFGFWGSGECLLWWIKNGRVPPLVTVGGNGVPGSPGTRVLVDNLDFVDDFRQGGRFALGYQFETVPFLGVEANYFFLSDRRSDFSFSSGGDPVLGQPYINVATGKPAATLISSPGIAGGTVTIGAQTSLMGAEANLTAGLISSCKFHLTALGGFRFLRLGDELRSGERFQVSPSVPGFGGNTAVLQDEFRTVNDFYGGQAGLLTGVQLGRLTIDCCGKIGLGQMQQVADVNGRTSKLAPDGSTTSFQGGLFALRSNIGRHQRDELAFIPEVGLNLGLALTSHWKVYAGYSFLWVSTVARAGEQIDPVVNVSQFPLQSANGPLVGPARPAFNFAGTDFWVQGLNLGLELRY